MAERVLLIKKTSFLLLVGRCRVAPLSTYSLNRTKKSYSQYVVVVVANVVVVVVTAVVVVFFFVVANIAKWFLKVTFLVCVYHQNWWSQNCNHSFVSPNSILVLRIWLM